MGDFKIEYVLKMDRFFLYLNLLMPSFRPALQMLANTFVWENAEEKVPCVFADKSSIPMSNVHQPQLPSVHHCIHV